MGCELFSKIIFVFYTGANSQGTAHASAKARICKSLRSSGIDSRESTPLVWESIPGLLKKFTNSGSADAPSKQGHEQQEYGMYTFNLCNFLINARAAWL
jgi:hypothetical protein